MPIFTVRSLAGNVPVTGAENFSGLMEEVSSVITHLTCIQEVPDTNLNQELSILAQIFYDYSQSFQVNDIDHKCTHHPSHFVVLYLPSCRSF
jgi:hypothetical protein